ncbi:MAG: 50S ribosomal protein L35 [Gammaproteobacteria bacterium]|jgi:large subunit ribosomal protein L35
MPKMKSNRGAAKRFAGTATGRYKHRQSHRSHILTKKSSKRIRQLRDMKLIHPSDQKAVKRLTPYT